MQVRCLKCKGRGYCGRKFCAVKAKSEARYKVKEILTKEDFAGSSPTPFIGHHGYPYLNVGILSIPEIKENAWEYDAPRYWAANKYDIGKIVNFRSSLINSRFKAHATDKTRLLELSQEVGMAAKPVDIEIELKQKPQFRLNTSAEMAPTGPNANLLKAKITSNTKIPRKVDKVVSDIDLKSMEAIQYLYKNNFDENFLTRLLSIGTLGVKAKRHLVPTRWSITAIDDNLGKNLIEEIKNFSETNYYAYFGGYLGNYYLILTFPEKWSYELFEMYMPKASWNESEEISFSTDHEMYSGRKTYAQETAGGYYACRLGLLEKLQSQKRQGTVVVLRFITGEYAMPLGVWVCREATRKALAEKPIEFGSKELMMKYVEIMIKRKFGFDINKILKKSVLLKEMKSQSKLSNYF